MPQTYTNLAISTLASSYTVGDTTVTVDTGQGSLFPSSGNFTIGINDPPTFFLQCTSRSSDVLTVGTSATEGTTAANASSGSPVAQVVTAGVLDGIRADISVVGLYASLPTSGMKAGDRYYTTDSPYSFVYTGSAWQAYAFNYAVTVPPSTGWAFDQTITGNELDQTNGTIWMANPVQGSYKVAAYYRSPVLTPPYRAAFLLAHDITGNYPGVNGSAGNATESSYMIGFRDTSSTLVSIGVFYTSSQPEMVAHTWGNAGNTVSSLRTFGVSVSCGEFAYRTPCWLAVRDDGTDIYFEWSIDAFHWRTFYSESRTAHLASTPQPFIGSYNYYTPTIANLISYSESVP